MPIATEHHDIMVELDTVQWRNQIHVDEVCDIESVESDARRWSIMMHYLSHYVPHCSCHAQ